MNRVQTPYERKIMNGVDPYAYMQQVSMRLNEINSRNEIETVLDELAYPFEVIPPRDAGQCREPSPDCD
jgi:hypothetical protein